MNAVATSPASANATAAANAAAVVDIRRVIKASPEDLYDAWLDPESIGQWMRPFDTIRTDATVDARVGGRYGINMHTPGGLVEHFGEYVALERPGRIVFTWNSPHTGGDSLVTITMTAQGNGATEVHLVHEKLPADKVAAHNGGWTGALDRLVPFAEGRAGHG